MHRFLRDVPSSLKKCGSAGEMEGSSGQKGVPGRQTQDIPLRKRYVDPALKVPLSHIDGLGSKRVGERGDGIRAKCFCEWPGQMTKCPGFRQGTGRTACSLEQIPQELVVDLVVKLHFLRLYEGSQKAGAAVGGGFFQLGEAAF